MTNRERALALILGALVASASNLALFASTRALGGLGDGVVARATGAPIGPFAVVTASVFGVGGAVVLRAVLERLLSWTRARGLFVLLSLVALILSFVTPFTGIDGASLADRLVLEAMHLVTGTAAVAAVEVAFRRRWRFGASMLQPAQGLAPSTALVTGATSGIGAEVALALARRGFFVVGIGRSSEKARALVARAEAEGGPGRLDFALGDLTRTTEVRRLAAEVRRRAPAGFAIVVHCAGTLKLGSRPNAEGIDEGFAASFLGRFALMTELGVDPGTRLVNVAASEHGRLPRWARRELRRPADVGTGMAAHGRAQVANDLWVASLARRGLRAYGYGPGAVDTGIRRELPPLLVGLLRPLFWAETRPPADAADDVIRLLLDEALPQGGFASREGLFSHDPWILDPDRQDALTALAERMILSARSSAEGPGEQVRGSAARDSAVRDDGGLRPDDAASGGERARASGNEPGPVLHPGAPRAP